MVASYWTPDDENQGSMTGGGFLQQLYTSFLHIRTVQHLHVAKVLFIHQLMH
jgi:hypothetical protein